MLYCLKPFLVLWRLHHVFNIIKLTTISKNLIPSIHSYSLSDLIIIDKEEELEVEKVLDSCWHYQKY